MARALARARLVLRLGIDTHRRSIAAHRRALRELTAELEQLEDVTEALGLPSVIDDNAQSEGGHSE